MDNIPAVSIVIPTYNRPLWLKQAIESALNQRDVSLEVVVVDDGSTNIETRTIATQYSAVSYLYQPNQGLGSARNTGIKASRGEFIQFLDDDDWLVEDSVSRKLERFGRSQAIGVVFSDLYLTDANGLVKGLYYSDQSRPLPSGDIYETLLRSNFIPIHAMLWRRSILEQIDGFPCRSGSEDWEAVVRTAEITHFFYLDEPLGYYRLHNQNMTIRVGLRVQGASEVQQYIAGSERFNQLSGPERARILSSYGLEQWIEGDSVLGRRFCKMANQCDPTHPFPWLLKGFMLLGRPAGRYLMHLSWNLRYRFRKLSAPGYFLTKSGKNLKNHV